MEANGIRADEYQKHAHPRRGGLLALRLRGGFFVLATYCAVSVVFSLDSRPPPKA
jgi:hypothetical protein